MRAARYDNPPMSQPHTIDHLNESFGISTLARFEAGMGGMTRLAISTPAASAHVYLHGAHVTHYQPAGQEPVLFLSSKSMFEPGKPIRGGVPIIFPWFGPRASDGVMHGFVRTRPWDVESLRKAENDAIQVVLKTQSTDETRSLWPHDFTAKMRIVIGKRLTMTLRIENSSNAAFSFENAMHSYYAVSNVRDVVLGGLYGADYLDKNLNLERVRDDASTFQPTGPMDRVYLNSSSTCTINDPGFSRRIVIEKSGSRTTVVWNPWSENMAKFADMAADEWSRFLCVETANAKENAVMLAPGASHEMTAIVRVESLR